MTRAEEISLLPAVRALITTLALKTKNGWHAYVDQETGKTISVSAKLKEILRGKITNVMTAHVLRRFKIPTYVEPERPHPRLSSNQFSIERVEYRSQDLTRWQIVDEYNNCISVHSDRFDASQALADLESQAELEAENSRLAYRHRHADDADTDDTEADEGDEGESAELSGALVEA
jgi:hypothetical protein